MKGLAPLDEAVWTHAGGLSPEWRAVGARRAADARDALERIAGQFRALAPAAVKRSRYLSGLELVLRRAKSAPGRRLLTDPCMDYWLGLWGGHFDPRQAGERDWRLHFGFFQGFAAVAARRTGAPGVFDAALDGDAHLHFYGSPAVLRFPKEWALKTARIELRSERLLARGPGSKAVAFPASLIDAPSPASAGALSWSHCPEVRPGILVADCGFLVTHPITAHGAARLGEGEKTRFAEVLGRALDDLRARDPLLHEELSDLLRLLIPLRNPENRSSVSSSYVSMRGAIGLSHSESEALQAETLIHEFCHQKLNVLLPVDPILEPGQGARVFYSPWRDDPRRLRGLLLGAHAFINVARYHVSRGEELAMTARRLAECEAALQTLRDYAAPTPFGRRFLRRLWSDLARLRAKTRSYPSSLFAEAAAACRKHRERFAVAGTGLHV